MRPSHPFCSSYIGFQSTNVCNSRSPCWCTKHFIISCLSAYLEEDRQVVSVTGRWRLCSSDIDTCLVQRTNTRLGDRSFAAAGPRVWKSLNPAARVGHYTRTISTSTRNTSISRLINRFCQRQTSPSWNRADWQCFSRAVYALACLLAYLLRYSANPSKTSLSITGNTSYWVVPLCVAALRLTYDRFFQKEIRRILKFFSVISSKDMCVECASFLIVGRAVYSCKCC